MEVYAEREVLGANQVDMPPSVMSRIFKYV